MCCNYRDYPDYDYDAGGGFYRQWAGAPYGGYADPYATRRCGQGCNRRRRCYDRGYAEGYAAGYSDRAGAYGLCNGYLR